jgi:hypothetical protein
MLANRKNQKSEYTTLAVKWKVHVFDVITLL